MSNTLKVELPKLSNMIYKEWERETILVQSCDKSFEGEFNLETREIDIPVYHDLSIHQTTIKEHELKPAPIEFMRSSVKRVTIDKGRYSHYGETNLGKLIEKLSEENSETRKKLINKWARTAEDEVAIFCAKLTGSQSIDMTTILGGVVTKDNILKVIDVLKAKVIEKNMNYKDFKLFVSERFATIARDTKIAFGSLPADEAFTKGFVGLINDVDTREHNIPVLTSRSSTSSLVEAEWAIWKTRDGIQYVVPYKNTIQYEIQPTEVLMGGKGYQILEYYDFFNLYPGRLYNVKLSYAVDSNSQPVTPPATASMSVDYK